MLNAVLIASIYWQAGRGLDGAVIAAQLNNVARPAAHPSSFGVSSLPFAEHSSSVGVALPPLLVSIQSCFTTGPPPQHAGAMPASLAACQPRAPTAARPTSQSAPSWLRAGPPTGSSASPACCHCRLVQKFAVFVHMSTKNFPPNLMYVSLEARFISLAVDFSRQ